MLFDNLDRGKKSEHQEKEHTICLLSETSLVTHMFKLELGYFSMTHNFYNS